MPSRSAHLLPIPHPSIPSRVLPVFVHQLCDQGLCPSSWADSPAVRGQTTKSSERMGMERAQDPGDEGQAGRKLPNPGPDNPILER